MFGIWPTRSAEVLKHWYVLLPNFQASTASFYQSIEEELRLREVPGLEVAWVEFPEGNVFSARRIYLRLRRERYVFDVCSAPFGTSWFFSCRFAEIPMGLRVWELIVILAFLFLSWSLYVFTFGMIWGTGVAIATFASFLYLLNTVAATGLYDLDALLLKIPVLGAFYETFIRRDTYYRQDTRLMYCDLIDAVVKTKIEELAGAHQISNVPYQQDQVAEKPDGFLERLLSIWDWIFKRV